MTAIYKKNILRFFPVVILFIIVSTIPTGCSYILSSEYSPSYPAWPYSNTNHFRLIMSEQLYLILTEQKPGFTKYPISFEFNENTCPFAVINLHGKGGLNYNRKSFEIKTAHTFPVEVAAYGSFDEFFLISMDCDIGYMNHSFSYSILKEFDLFTPRFFLTEVIINNTTLGMYMFMEKTQNAVCRQVPNTEFILRRGMQMEYELMYFKPSHSGLSIQDYKDHYLDIYTLNKFFQGRLLYKELSIRMNIDRYMRWLAFNTFVKNGDYTDEVFFYGWPGEKGKPYFDISVWDYDDLFKKPHCNNFTPGSLIYCNENFLDRVIEDDPYLYRKFQEHFLYMLEYDITDTYLDAVFSATENAIQPFFTPRTDILAIQYNLDELKYSRDWNGFLSYYNDQLTFLKARRATLITILRENIGIIP